METEPQWKVPSVEQKGEPATLGLHGQDAYIALRPLLFRDDRASVEERCALSCQSLTLQNAYRWCGAIQDTAD